MPFPRTFFLGVLLSSLALVGFGCKKIEHMNGNTTATLANRDVLLPTISVKTPVAKPIEPEKPRKQPHPEVLRIRELMTSFQKSTSFRAKMRIGGEGGIQGDIAYDQEKGTYGKLMLGNGLTSEMVLYQERVAIKNGTSTWSEITDTPEAAQIMELFKAVTNRATTEPLYPARNARYVSAADDETRGCKMHNLSQFMGNLGGYQPIAFCIANRLPVYFSVPSEDGLVEVEYRDIDKPVEVFFPL